MPLTITETGFEGLLLLEPRVFGDARGYFIETYNHREWLGAGVNHHFVQDNQSLSAKNTVRGLHFQRPPHAQAKLVRVIQGSALDVVVDIRRGSPTYGKNFTTVLSADNFVQLYIPEGFAHGFATLEDNTLFIYKCSDYYNPAVEDGLPWNDMDLGIEWNIDSPILSERDRNFKSFKEFESPFTF
jgi:dTDP-4-dehydrorhamnose 3,5-epimerase